MFTLNIIHIFTPVISSKLTITILLTGWYVEYVDSK